MDDLQVLTSRLLASEVPESVADRWLGLALPQFVFTRMSDAEVRSGKRPAGWYGGHPRVPLDVDLGGYPHYIAAVDCGALPPATPGPRCCAREGSLLLFATRDAEAVNEREFEVSSGWSLPIDVLSGALLHCAEDAPVHEWRLDESPGEPNHFRTPFPLQCTEYWGLPGGGHGVILLDDELRDLFRPYERQLADAKAANRLSIEKEIRHRGVLRMGGYPTVYQNDPTTICNREELFGRRDWCMLAEWGRACGPKVKTSSPTGRSPARTWRSFATTGWCR